jgi:hypothetical protein
MTRRVDCRIATRTGVGAEIGSVSRCHQRECQDTTAIVARKPANIGSRMAPSRFTQLLW